MVMVIVSWNVKIKANEYEKDVTINQESLWDMI
jgi:hypothetical protein